ncbi:helix-turn-helix domain-containing protein [Niameybacter massiliensis]|uniref:helix-turn-helix domain-containing protein n=1 Tax=Niameybacter massiliensis TaxID=1658108 RepID=UPI0006B654A6|nr:helix-turn-helix transcriptional regulator [Niameybacter massiliensis]
MSFADILKKQRSIKKISQRNLAEMIGVSQQTIGSWETERTEPDQVSLNKLADFFSISTDYLLGRTEDKSNAQTLDSDIIQLPTIRIKSLRIEKGLSQEELGSLLNIQKSAISKYERGALEPGKSMLIKMSSIFNCSVDYLLGLSSVRNENNDQRSIDNDKDPLNFTTQFIKRKSIQLLFNRVKSLSDSDIEKIIKFIDIIEDKAN